MVGPRGRTPRLESGEADAECRETACADINTASWRPKQQDNSWRRGAAATPMRRRPHRCRTRCVRRQLLESVGICV